MILLTRDEFRKLVFDRDGDSCVLCGADAQDAHHIMERRLWPDGGYYLENGASVCGKCHLRCEATLVSCEEVRAAAGIKTIAMPPHLYADAESPYDKWGNPILPNGQRMRGELFDDESVQKVLAPVLHIFTDKVKYPRTYHLTWSPGATKDDRFMKNYSGFERKRVVVTLKMDGENTTMYPGYGTDRIHARSLDYSPHPSRNYVRSLHGRLGADIPEGWRVCGENCYAAHSIQYKNLPDHFLMFSIWNGMTCLSWDETVEWAQLLGVKMVPVIYDGVWNEDVIKKLHEPIRNGDQVEGYVVRRADAFPYNNFHQMVGKYVRAGHVGDHGHWSKRSVISNGVQT